MDDSAPQAFMRRALELARGVWGETSPNPMVGAVIVEDGKIVAEGATAPDGGPHAERRALEALGRKPGPGATLYVTLEPCSTAGRTGACTDAIIAAGIKRVVAGATDPWPEHAGKGYEVLRQAGVEVVSGLMERECAELNFIFNHWASRGRPLLAGKIAMTLDGRIATRTGHSQWITGEEARLDAHRWRRLFPAIAVGAETVMQDDPRLTARWPQRVPWCPVRFVLDGRLRSVALRPTAHVYTDEFRERTVVVASAGADPERVNRLGQMGVNLWTFECENFRVPWDAFARRCAQERISGVLIEGGARVLSGLLRERALDYLFVYHGALLLADEQARPAFTGLEFEDLARAIRLAGVRHADLGDDSLMRGRVVY